MIAKTLKRGSIGLGGLLLLGVAGLSLTLGTSTGRNMLAGIVEDVVSGPDFGLEIGHIGGTGLGDLQVESITLRDAQGPWLRITDLALDWNPFALFTGRLDANRLAAEQVTVSRLPASGESRENEETGSFGLPPIGIKVGELAVRRLDLEQPVLGAPAVLAISGSASLTDPGDALSGNLRIDRRDGAGGTLDARFAYRAPDQNLTVDARFNEPANGILASLLRLPGAPETTGRIVGGGPLSDFKAELDLEAGGERILGGTVETATLGETRRLTAILAGQFSYLVPQDYREILEGENRIVAQVDRGQNGSLIINRADLTARNASLTLTAEGDTDLNITRARLAAELVRPDGGMFTLPLGEGKPAVFEGAKLTAELGADEGPRPVTANLVLRDAALPDGQFSDLTIAFSGARQDQKLESLWTALRGRLRAKLANPHLSDAKLADLLGDNVLLDSRLAIAGNGVQIEDAALDLGAAVLRYQGTVSPEGAKGTASIAAANFGRFSGLVGMNLSGSGTLSATGNVGFSDLLFALTLDGTLRDLAVTAADGTRQQVPGAVRISGSAARKAEGGIALDQLKLTGEGLDVAVDGVVDTDRADINGKVHIGNLALINPRLAGALDAALTAQGTPQQASYALKVTGQNVKIEGQAFDQPELTFTGAGPLAYPRGELTLSGRFQDRDLKGTASIARTEQGDTRVENIDFVYGAARVAGGLMVAANGTPNGALKVNVDDFGAFRSFVGKPLAGGLNADISFEPRGSDVVAVIKGIGQNLMVDSTRISSVAIDARVDDLMKKPVAQGSARISGVKSGGLEIGTVTVDAAAADGATRLNVATAVAGASLQSTATIAVADGNVSVGLEKLQASSQGETLALARPVTITVRDGRVTIPEAVLASRGGRIVVAGSAGSDLDLRVNLEKVPALLISVVAPDLGAAGLINGNAVIRGPSASPAISYQLDWSGAALAATRSAGLPPLSITARGATENNRITLNGNVKAAGDMNLTVTGSAPMGAGDLALQARGAIPSSLLNPMLGNGGATIRGTVNVDVNVSGPTSNPQIGGLVSTAGAIYNDPGLGLVLNDINLRARLNGKNVVVELLEATSSAGGKITGSGNVSIDPATGMPADVRIRANAFKINDKRMLDGEVSADLSLTGSLMKGPVLGGTVNIGRMYITIPEQLPKSIADLNVTHVNAPAKVQARVDRQKAKESSSSSLPIALDITINAGNQIFIRGRGLDVVLGGKVQITGTAANPVGIGGFQLRSGNLSVLGKRLEFREGTVDFLGSFDPELNFAAQSSAGGVTAIVRVTGKASDPKFAFESTPPLPQDEVLSRLIFDKPLDQLSPMQVAQLSMEVARLGGLGGGPGLLDELRRGLGVDVLEFSGDSEKNTAAVSAGKYVNDNVYVGVKQSTDGTSSAVVDLNVTRNIQLKGEVDSQGGSKVGIGVEWDY